MRVTKSELRKMIKEELGRNKSLNESFNVDNVMEKISELMEQEGCHPYVFEMAYDEPDAYDDYIDDRTMKMINKLYADFEKALTNYLKFTSKINL